MNDEFINDETTIVVNKPNNNVVKYVVPTLPYQMPEVKELLRQQLEQNADMDEEEALQEAQLKALFADTYNASIFQPEN